MPHLALLRGINVGGKNILAKDDLIQAFIDAGCTDVTTYIQSGNVVFRATPAVLKRVADSVAKLIAERHGIATTIVVRSVDQLVDAIRKNPFLPRHPAEMLHLIFLKDACRAELVRALEPVPGSSEEFIVRGQHIYLRAPNGLGRSKLPNFDRKLAAVGTTRNWRTVLKLLEMMQDA